jgi:8-oxo-dGTP pyrophosphatase MutT (NUDIX family)
VLGCYKTVTKPEAGNGPQSPDEKVKKDRAIPTASHPATQHAALCYRLNGPVAEVLLVSSRDTGRWVLPKGWPKKGEDGAASALREAHEEAGVIGRALPGCVGVYSYDKLMPSGPAIPCCVTVHAVEVAYLAYRFPERDERRRQWFALADAARAVAEPELRALLLAFELPPSDGARAGKG